MVIESKGETGVTVGAARTIARLAKAAEVALGTVELSLPQYRVLVFLSTHDAAAASALAARLDVTRPTITALVDGLVARRLVQRRPATVDRRRVEHRLTAEGERRLAAADDAVTGALTSIAGHLDPDDAVRATDGLERWGEGLSRARSAYWNDVIDRDPNASGAGTSARTR